MKELKTLKDLENRELKLEDYASESFDKGTRVYTKKRIDRFRNKLKAEAVKWVKEWKKYRDKVKTKDDLTYFNAKIGAFRIFFNLTESDLEEKE